MTANRISLDRFGRCYHQRMFRVADLRYSRAERGYGSPQAPVSQLLCDWLDNTYNGRITSERRDTIQWAFEHSAYPV